MELAINEAHKAAFIAYNRAQGYTLNHCKWLAAILYPTPEQARMRNARAAKKAKKGD